MPLSPRRSLRLQTAALVTFLAALTACSPTTDATPDDTPVTPEDATSGFPVSIEHAFGATEITKKPERIVTLGWYSQDIVAALGTVPLGVPDFTWGSVETYLPWFEDRVTELGGEPPAIVSDLDGTTVSFEKIGALEPDLIIAAHSGISEEDYKKLSTIAPTIGYAETPWVSDDHELTLTIGRALGQEEEAQALLDEADDAIAAAASEHPEFEGVTFTYGWYLLDSATTFDFYLNGDPRVPLVESLGFTVSPQVEKASDGTTSLLSISLEEIASIESDFHIGWAQTQQEIDDTVNNPAIAHWGPFAKKSYAFIDDQRLGWATSAPSVLSIPDTIGDLADELAAGLAGAE